MTTLTLPNEIINKIFTYIEGNNNQIIKKELIELNSGWGGRNRNFSICNIKYALDLLKSNLIKNKNLSNKTIRYGKYFKYSILHLKRKILFRHIKSLRNLINKYNYNDYYYNYTKIFNIVREKYIYNIRYTYDLTRRKFRQYYNVHFKYTILYNNYKKVCNDIKRYNTKKRGIVINYNKK